MGDCEYVMEPCSKHRAHSPAYGMYTLTITVEVLSGWFSDKWGKESVKKLVLEAVYLMAVKKKKSC